MRTLATVPRAIASWELRECTYILQKEGTVGCSMRELVYLRIRTQSRIGIIDESCPKLSSLLSFNGEGGSVTQFETKRIRASSSRMPLP